MNLFDEINREWQFDKSTPLMLVKRFAGHIMAARLGSIQNYPNWTDTKESVPSYGSEIYRYSVFKPFIKFAKPDTAKEIEAIDEQIKELQNKRREILKAGWKKSKKILLELDLIPVLEERRKFVNQKPS